MFSRCDRNVSKNISQSPWNLAFGRCEFCSDGCEGNGPSAAPVSCSVRKWPLNNHDLFVLNYELRLNQSHKSYDDTVDFDRQSFSIMVHDIDENRSNHNSEAYSTADHSITLSTCDPLAEANLWARIAENNFSAWLDLSHARMYFPGELPILAYINSCEITSVRKKTVQAKNYFWPGTVFRWRCVLLRTSFFLQKDHFAQAHTFMKRVNASE